MKERVNFKFIDWSEGSIDSLDRNVCPEEKITEVNCPSRRPEFLLVTDLLEVGQNVIPQTLVHSHEDT